ncbi:hypothetical protein BH11MYX1_BH11MYX1_01000 [soil metagenome]
MRRFAKFLPLLAVFGTVSAIAAPDAPAGAAPAKPSMSNVDMNISVAQIDTRLEADSQQMIHLQEVAKKQKDVIKLNCVNDRLVQAKAQRNIADDLHSQLTAAIQKNSDDREGLYRQYVATSEALKELREQAKACVGETELFKQESGVTVDAPLTPDDPTIMSPSSDPVEPPGYASPFD